MEIRVKRSQEELPCNTQQWNVGQEVGKFRKKVKQKKAPTDRPEGQEGERQPGIQS